MIAHISKSVLRAVRCTVEDFENQMNSVFISEVFDSVRNCIVYLVSRPFKQMKSFILDNHQRLVIGLQRNVNFVRAAIRFTSVYVAINSAPGFQASKHNLWVFTRTKTEIVRDVIKDRKQQRFPDLPREVGIKNTGVGVVGCEAKRKMSGAVKALEIVLLFAVGAVPCLLR